MSNPSINRWGLNLFWYCYWFTDKNYYLNLQQDTLILKLIYIFLNYGTLFPKNIFKNKYWFFNKFNFDNYFNSHNTKYYRIVNFKNATMGIDSCYHDRIGLKNIYYGKIWILKFQNWLIVNYYCFQPIKKKKLTANLFKKSPKGASLYLAKSTSDAKALSRTKLFLFFSIFNKFNNTKNYYRF